MHQDFITNSHVVPWQAFSFSPWENKEKPKQIQFIRFDDTSEWKQLYVSDVFIAYYGCQLQKSATSSVLWMCVICSFACTQLDLFTNQLQE